MLRNKFYAKFKKVYFWNLGQYFGSCYARQLKLEHFSTVKKHENRLPVQAKDSVLLNPASPFLKGLTPKSMSFAA